MTIHTLDRVGLKAAAGRLARQDPLLAGIYDQLGPPPMWKRPASFATFVRIILEQQVSLASAKSTFERLSSRCESRVTPARVLQIGPVGLRELGFTRQKTRYVVALAEDVSAKRFKIGSLRQQEDEAVRCGITARLGLGDWSADVFLLMALCRRDIFPIGDLALVKGIAELDGGRCETREKVFQRAERWRPYRSVATRMIWQSYLHRRGKQ